MLTDKPLTALQHLEALRKHMLRAAVVTIIMVGLGFYFYTYIVEYFTKPVTDLLAEHGIQGGLLVIRSTETWAVASRLAFMLGIAGSLPFYMAELSWYLWPAMKRHERKYLLMLPPGSLLLFAGGAAFGYFVLVPSFYGFLLDFAARLGEVIEQRPTLESTVGLMTSFMFWMGFIFQIPIFMFIAAKIGLIRAKSLTSKRKWVILLAFVFGAAITPTADPLTQTLAALPILGLYELGILLVKLSERSANKPKSVELQILRQ